MDNVEAAKKLQGAGMRVTRSEVEEILCCKISNELFEKALKEARQKQKYIYFVEHRAVVLQHWYLVKLTEEYVRILAFADLTEDICKMRNMEKEHPTKSQSAHLDNHIVADPDL